MKEIRDLIRFWDARNGQPLALATLVSAQGSSYRRPGARMLINASGDYAGGVSAGCIEDEVIACSRKVLRNGEPQLLTFDTRLRFGCNGTIQIFVEVARADVMNEVRECIANRQNCRLETLLRGNTLGTRLAGFHTRSDSFVQNLEPVLRLVLVGDSSDTIALRTQAALLGWNILQYEAPPVPADAIDNRTAVVVATHHFGRDCAALRDLLPTQLRYLGLVGSRRRRDDILFDVLNQGLTVSDGLFAPAGLHLGAETPEEIALSIVTEIQCVFASGTAQQLRHRSAPIHQALPAALAPCTASAA
ncbi:XdhC family protein [Prosthecobacter sp.]|uniref:XdhC family protein n=1 Tax=Prosthecobacter sp. TaxID=1965333 RepID=UPI00378386BB